jgi:hypothetical protein
MRSIQLLLMSAVAVALVLAGAGGAQPPGPKPEPMQKFVRPAPISVDDIVERIMSFDKNKDGMVTRDELPERMQFLIDRGDTNKDGALDRDEIRKLVTARAPGPGAFGGRVEGFAGPVGLPPPGGFGGRVEGFAGPGGFGGRSDSGIIAPGPGSGAIEGVVDDLKLSDKKKDRAMTAVRAHQENVRKLMDQARAQLLQQMKEILSEEELKDFEAALDRPRGGTVFLELQDGPRPPDVEKRIEQLQKELDDLRRQLRR